MKTIRKQPKCQKSHVKIAKIANPELHSRMEQIRRSGAAGVHADQNKRKDSRAIRREGRRTDYLMNMHAWG